MKNTFKKFKTTPLINIFRIYAAQEMSEYYSKYLYEYMVLCDKNSPPITSHIKKLGKQNYCWVSQDRLYIWENGSSWRVFVGKNKGICFEVNEEFSLKEALGAWNDYLQKMTG